MTEDTARFCPYCSGAATLSKRAAGMYDCPNRDCRMRFTIGYSRRRRKSPGSDDRIAAERARSISLPDPARVEAAMKDIAAGRVLTARQCRDELAARRKQQK